MSQIIIEITSPMGRQLAVLRMPGEVLIKETSPDLRYSTDEQVAKTIIDFIEQNGWRLYDKEKETTSIRRSIINIETHMLTLDAQTFAAKEFRIPVVARQYSPLSAGAPKPVLPPPRPIPSWWILFMEATIKTIVDALIGKPLHFVVSLIMAILLRIIGHKGEDQRKEL